MTSENKPAPQALSESDRLLAQVYAKTKKKRK
jgi:hypothetical protein